MNTSVIQKINQIRVPLKTLFKTLKAEILNFFQIQLYNKEKPYVPKITQLLKSVVTNGPSIVNLNPYNKILIPIVNHKAANGIINMLLFKYLRPQPKLRPNNPVVKMDTNSSLGWSIANRNMVPKYVITPILSDKRVASTRGPVFIMLRI